MGHDTLAVVEREATDAVPEACFGENASEGGWRAPD